MFCIVFLMLDLYGYIESYLIFRETSVLGKTGNRPKIRKGPGKTGNAFFIFLSLISKKWLKSNQGFSTKYFALWFILASISGQSQKQNFEGSTSLRSATSIISASISGQTYSKNLRALPRFARPFWGLFGLQSPANSTERRRRVK